ncbi:hypothetical protein B0H17DRAFT_1262317, partial [Mycena rosella]
MYHVEHRSEPHCRGFIYDPAFTGIVYRLYNYLVLQGSYIWNQSLAIWDFDSSDTRSSTVAQSEALYNGIMKNHPASVLAVNHDTHASYSHQVLPYAISKLQGAGYHLITLAECLGMSPYQ